MLKVSKLKVLFSNAGHYIGRTYEEEGIDFPYSRESTYFSSRARAEEELLRREQIEHMLNEESATCSGCKEVYLKEQLEDGSCEDCVGNIEEYNYGDRDIPILEQDKCFDCGNIHQLCTCELPF
jgi:hypothetical protein